MTFHLTFNKPAVKHFIESDDDHSGLRIKIEHGQVMFMPAKEGKDTASLSPRTRGGYKAVIEGEDADKILSHLKNPHGPFFVLKRASKDWIAAIPYTKPGAPPKFEPHVRLWTEDGEEEVTRETKPTKKSKKVATKPTVATTKHEDPIERIRWAFRKVEEPKKPGRPSNELQEAKNIVNEFEQEALAYVAQTEPRFSPEMLNDVVQAYFGLQNFLKIFHPDALINGPKSADELAAEQLAIASHKLGLDVDRSPMIHKIAGPINLDAFAGRRPLNQTN